MRNHLTMGATMTNHLIHTTLAKRQLVAGVVIAIAGGVIAVTGMLLSAFSAVASARRWARHLDPPAREVAKSKWRQARAASIAGAGAWRVAAATPEHHAWDAISSPTPAGRG
jgi:hypothetical protein